MMDFDVFGAGLKARSLKVAPNGERDTGKARKGLQGPQATSRLRNRKRASKCSAEMGGLIR